MPTRHLDRTPSRAPRTEPSHPLLAALGPDGRALMAANLRAVERPRNARLSSAGASYDAIYFITDGLVAIQGRTADGAAAEIGLVGAGGLVGVSALLQPEHTAVRDAVALTPVSALALHVAALGQLASLYPDLHRRLLGYANDRIDHAGRLCVCAALHGVDQRVARWLLDATTCSGGRPLHVTHAQIAGLLGVRRASVTAALHLLEGDQAVWCRRGRIEVRNVAALTERSCGCHMPRFSLRRTPTGPCPTSARPATFRADVQTASSSA